jgi:hypothetical protein
VEIEVHLDRRLLSRILGFYLVAENGKEQKVDGVLAGAVQFVELPLLAGQNAADAIGFEFGVGWGHEARAGRRAAKEKLPSCCQGAYKLPWMVRR